MDIYLILLRLIHILAGVLWAGAAISYFFFMEPTVKGLGRPGPSSCRTWSISDAILSS